MNELRWILLVAGALLIAGLYLWGTRTRWQGRGEAEASRRPAVFTGGAKGFETEVPVPPDDADVDERGIRVPRRIPCRAPHRAWLRTRTKSTRLMRRNRVASISTTRATSNLRRSGGANRPCPRPEPMPSPTLRPEPPLARRADAEARARSRRCRASRSAAPSETTGAGTTARRRRSLAIRVTAAAPARFDGAQLLAALRAEGLGFGRYEIFHCLHDDGRPIYSVASLREPGTFDIEAMPTTYYPGIAMFAVLPGPVPAAEAFDEMIFAARALATHLSGSLTDERGAPLTTLRVGKLREEALEFERGAGSA